MLVTTSRYRELQSGNVRPLSTQLSISFDKSFDDAITFFTLDTSVLDGVDILSDDETTEISQWNKYQYTSYTDRLIQAEWQREEVFPFSVNQSMADVTLNNYDSYFTRGAGSPLENYLLPKRPLRILAGFGNETLPQFVGLTTAVPIVDKAARTATLHAMDFLSYLFDKPLDKTVVLENYRTDQVLAFLLDLFGLVPGQYDLDEGFNIIPFVYFEKGKKLGDAVKQLMEAELGSFFMDETGLIVFRNRLQSNNPPVATFTADNIIDYSSSDESTIINVVEIKANVRVVQPTQTIYTLVQAFEISAAGTTELFFNFDDPVTGIDPITTYTANTAQDGSGSDVTSSITVTATDLFNTAVKVTFTNSTGSTAWLTSLIILGTPAKVARNIYLRASDQDSIDKFEEQVFTIENDFIQSDDAAQSVALSLLNYYKEYASTIEFTVKGDYALQIGDSILLDIDNINQEYVISKIVNIVSKAQFTQRITAKIFNIPDFFTLDVSVLDGNDVLAF